MRKTFLLTVVGLFLSAVCAFAQTDENPQDMTSSIVNPKFDSSNADGWTIYSTAQNTQIMPNNSSADAPTWEFWDPDAVENKFDMYQEIANLPAGRYTLGADIFNSNNGQAPEENGGRVYLFAKVDVNGGTTTYGVPVEPSTEDVRKPYAVTFDVPEGAMITVGIKTNGKLDARWVTVDNFSLNYYGTESQRACSDEVTLVIYTNLIVTCSAQETTSDLLAQIGEENTGSVVNLKVSGTINSWDMMIMRNKMPNLRYLDLSDATIVANSYCYKDNSCSQDNVFPDFLSERSDILNVVLPKNITSIEPSAFSKCSGLTSIEIPESVNSIGARAFAYCEGIRKIVFPENVTYIPTSVCFWCSALEEVVFSPNTTCIAQMAFSSCRNLKKVYLPPYLKTVENDVFSLCNGIQEVYAYMTDIATISSTSFDNTQNIILYVPEFLFDEYYWDSNWSEFYDLRSCDLKPGDYESFYTDRDIVFDEDDDRITEDTPDVEIGNQGGVTVEGEDNQEFGDVDQNIGEGSGGSIIGDNNITMDQLRVNINVVKNRWYFFCFPFEVKIADCEYPGKYSWKEYDGKERAEKAKGGWKKVEGEVLKAWKGYIFQSNKDGVLVVKFDKPTFGGDRPKDLEAHASNNAADASWNLVGNPYSCYYDFKAEDFDSPITVWNGTSYEAYRPGDDDYHLQPYEAFFVQKPETRDEIGFKAERRETYRKSKEAKEASGRMRMAAGVSPDRRILNFVISDNDSAAVDRTRLVLNNGASRNYELACDAAKFLSDDAALQIYTVEGTTQMSINERPADGDIYLGYVAKNEGMFRIETKRMDMPMAIVDTETGITFELSKGAYWFTSKAGTFNKRFKLIATEEATAILDITAKTGVAVGTQDGGISIGGAEGKTVGVYTVGGAKVAEQVGNGYVSLASGTYVVSVDGMSAKIHVK